MQHPRNKNLSKNVKLHKSDYSIPHHQCKDVARIESTYMKNYLEDPIVVQNFNRSKVPTESVFKKVSEDWRKIDEINFTPFLAESYKSKNRIPEIVKKVRLINKFRIIIAFYIILPKFFFNLYQVHLFYLLDITYLKISYIISNELHHATINNSIQDNLRPVSSQLC